MLAYDGEVGHRRRGLFVAYALLSATASQAFADDPPLADGSEASIELSTGPTMTSFAPLALALSQTGAYGRFVASSSDQAVSVEGVEKLGVVLDGVTPSFGFLGGGVRRVGHGFGSIDFERISTGVALTSRGSDLDAGIGAELAIGFLNASGSGLGVNAEAYFFNVSHFTGPDRLFVVSLGYVYSPFTGMRPAPASSPRPPAPPAPLPSGEPCRDLAAYRAALIEHRKKAVDACNAARADECKSEHDTVVDLDQKMEHCEQGQDVGPPR